MFNPPPLRTPVPAVALTLAAAAKDGRLVICAGAGLSVADDASMPAVRDCREAAQTSGAAAGGLQPPPEHNQLMLIYITGVAGSGKSTLREELERKGYQAEDADEGFCAWFDADGNQVPTLPLPLRTPEWYASHRWRLLPARVSGFAEACANGLGFLLGIAGNADEMAPYFGAAFFLTADTDVIHERLRVRDGAAHATRFAAFASVREWQQSAEQWWVNQGYAPLDSSGTPTEVADTLLQLVAPNSGSLAQ